MHLVCCYAGTTTLGCDTARAKAPSWLRVQKNPVFVTCCATPPKSTRCSSLWNWCKVQEKLVACVINTTVAQTPCSTSQRKAIHTHIRIVSSVPLLTASLHTMSTNSPESPPGHNVAVPQNIFQCVNWGAENTVFKDIMCDCRSPFYIKVNLLRCMDPLPVQVQLHETRLSARKHAFAYPHRALFRPTIRFVLGNSRFT